jgi:hypothetical protein
MLEASQRTSLHLLPILCISLDALHFLRMTAYARGSSVKTSSGNIKNPTVKPAGAELTCLLDVMQVTLTDGKMGKRACYAGAVRSQPASIRPP